MSNPAALLEAIKKAIAFELLQDTLGGLRMPWVTASQIGIDRRP